MIVNPIGAFNQNHDGPKWEFTDRPIAATQMLPATWSNAGFGLYGKYYKNEWVSWTNFLISDNIPKNMSHGEREIFRILNSENISFEMNKSFPDLSNGKLSFDFYIPSHNTLIEYDGVYP